jgi:tripartite-type tricarboxylate transporter receptor subunit TctC
MFDLVDCIGPCHRGDGENHKKAPEKMEGGTTMKRIERMQLASVLMIAPVLALAALLLSAVGGSAETYPSRPITMIVGFPPGGPTDALARIVAEGMRQSLGQPIVIQNVGGAGGTIGTADVVHANPDGYTIGIGNWTSHVGSPAIYPLQYDVQNDLEPVAFLAAAPLWILGKNDLPPKNATELIAWLKANPNPTTFGTVGPGSGAHMCGFFFAQKIGAKFQYVPYRGAGPAQQDLMGGQIDLSCLDGSSTIANVQAGKMRAYAVMSEKRWDKAPQTPTMVESGVPGLTISFWHGLWTTKGTPKAIVDRLDVAVKAALADPDVRKKLEAIGQVVATPEQATPQGLAAFHKAEIEKWWPIVKAADIKLNEAQK